MNVHARRRQVAHAIADIQEVVADILDESAQAGEEGLTAAEVRTRSGVPPTDFHYNVIRAVLHLMEEDKTAVDMQPGLGHAAWRLG